VASSYDLESEDFKVSFLAHEARHFSDQRKYKILSPSDLEYRAKLNEVFLADKSFETLLRKFLLEARNNPANPHSHASHRLVTELSAKLRMKIVLTTVHSLKKNQI
jgi:hypothetical protein